MLIRSVIWTIAVFICVVARSDNYGYTLLETNAIQKKMETSGTVRHLQMKLETAGTIRNVSGDALIRKKKSFELYDWLSQAQKQEIQLMGSEGKLENEIVNRTLELFSILPSEEKDRWNEVYKKQCNEWIERVASNSEMSELEDLKNKMDVKKYEAKLNEYKNRLSENEQDRINLWQDVCNKLNNLDIQQNTLRMKFRRDLFQNNKNARLFSNEQIALLEDMKVSEANEEDIKSKVEQYYSALPEYRRVKFDYQFKTKCIQWMQEVANFDEIQLFLSSFEMRNRLVFNILLDEYFKRLSKEQQDKLHYIKDTCREMWREAMNSNRQKRCINEEYNEWILWMTDEQKRELREMRSNGSSFDEIHQKVNGHFLKLPKATQNELINDYKEKCRKYFVAMVKEEEIEKLNTVHSETNHNEYKKIIDEVLNRQPQDIRDKAYKFYQICHDVYHKQLTRSKRDIDAAMEKHLQWLTSEQKAEIKQMKESGESLTAIKQKLFSYIDDTESDKRIHTVGKTKQSCYSWLEDVTSIEERAELENLHRTNHSACKRKIRQYIKRLSPEKQEAVNKDLEICEYIWYNEGNHGHEHHHNQHRAARWLSPQIYAETNSRSKRDHHGRNLEDYFQTYLSWLTDVEKDEIKKMKQEGKSKMDIQQKISNYYENLVGDRKKEAGEKLRGGCLELLKLIVGDEKMAELKQMKDSGVDLEELRAKVNDMLEHVTDEAKKQKIREYGPTCRKIYEMPVMRNKRDQMSDGLKHYSSSYLQWLTDEEKDEIQKVVERSKSGIDILKAIFFYYQNLHEEEKEKAGERLKLSCEEIVRSFVDENRLSELQALENDDSSMGEMMKMLSDTMDKSKFIQIKTYQAACHRIFSSKRLVRRKREYKDYSLDNYLQKNLKWLSVEQKEELKKMKNIGKFRADMIAKVFHYYDELFGEAKQHATELLYDGCQQILKEIIGGDQYNELVKMKDSSANVSDIKTKANAMLREIVDEEKKEKIKIYVSECRKIFAKINHKHPLNHKQINHKYSHSLKTDLKWLTKGRKDEMLKMKKGNKSEADIREKMLHFYEDLNEEAKKETAEFLHGACYDMIVNIFGNERAAELEKVKESLGNPDEIKREMEGMIDEIEDEEKRAKARKYGPICQKIFVNYYHKHHEHPVAPDFHMHLKWFSKAQQDEIKRMKANG